MTDKRLYLTVAACAVVVHIGALWNQFAMDDVTIIVWNPVVQSVGGVWRAFGAPYWPANLGGSSTDRSQSQPTHSIGSFTQRRGFTRSTSCGTPVGQSPWRPSPGAG